MGPDGAPIPGLTISVHLFSQGGDTESVPGILPTWGAQYVLNVDPLLSDGTIPAGAYMFMDTQLNAYNIVPDGFGFCESGFSEEDWINLNSGGPIQQGPNTANPNGDINVVSIPIQFAPQCSNNN